MALPFPMVGTVKKDGHTLPGPIFLHPGTYNGGKK